MNKQAEVRFKHPQRYEVNFNNMEQGQGETTVLLTIANRRTNWKY